MKDLITRINNTYCPVCKEDNLLELYEDNGRPIGYRAICKYKRYDDFMKLLNRTELSYLQCIKCKSRFYLDWRYGNLPKPYIKV